MKVIVTQQTIPPKAFGYLIVKNWDIADGRVPGLIPTEFPHQPNDSGVTVFTEEACDSNTRSWWYPTWVGHQEPWKYWLGFTKKVNQNIVACHWAIYNDPIQRVVYDIRHSRVFTLSLMGKSPTPVVNPYNLFCCLFVKEWGYPTYQFGCSSMSSWLLVIYLSLMVWSISSRVHGHAWISRLFQSNRMGHMKPLGLEYRWPVLGT